MAKWKDDKNVDDLLLNYLHFFGSYDFVGNSDKWYPHEIRIVKNNKNIYSYKDAQGFRKNNNEKLNVKPVDAYIYHYGWVKDPFGQAEKRRNYAQLYSPAHSVESKTLNAGNFDYSEIDSLEYFYDEHPEVMQEFIAKKNWSFDYDISWNKLRFKSRLKKTIKQFTGMEIGYKNYRLV